ncbi:MAG: energy transducer TonB [Bdellovibrionota bacterium]
MKHTSRLKIFITLSVAIHMGLASVVFVLPKVQQHFAPIEVVLIEPEEIEDAVKDEKNPTRIVETDEKSANEELNENAKYLSAKNNSVTKETQAKLGDKFQNTQQQAKKSVKAIKKSQPTLFGEKFNAYDSMAKKAADGKADINGKQQDFSQNAQNGNDRGIEATSADKLAQVEQTLKTQLNTKEYRYYGYYQRIKNQLNQFWQPEVKQKVSRLMTQGRTIASDSNNKVTKLIIVLNDAGTLVKVQVIGESGVRDLDEAAVEAFRQAAPFPNPPKGMVENDGTIKIRWDFVVES